MLTIFIYLIVPIKCKNKDAVTPRNLLYIVYDDLRPDLPFYGQNNIHAPNLQKLAKHGMIFERAYCQQAVCSPSRMSFTTGRRPNATKTWNFMNHFRQADCEVHNRIQLVGKVIVGGGWTIQKPEQSGGSGQCCTTCSTTPNCYGWSYINRTCQLYSKVDNEIPCPANIIPCLSGHRGSFKKWTPLPENFKNNGFLTLGVGKYFHDGCYGLGAAGGSDPTYPAGIGAPPMADPLSWTNNSIQYPDLDQYRKKWGNISNQYGRTNVYLSSNDVCGGPSYCNPPTAKADGSGAADSQGNPYPFCDFVTYKDAINKLQYAANVSDSTGQPFFMAVGIRRPHLYWRAPPSYVDFYPNSSITLPKHSVLDKSIDPIAWTHFQMLGGKTPFELSNTDITVRDYRKHYYAAISWGDYVAGRVLDELNRLGLYNNTAVIMHSDHGWHLGEYNMWQKRTNWELGVRVPLVLRVPWIPESHGKRTHALVELVDIYQTLCDLMDIPLPFDSIPFEGTSFVPLLKNPKRPWKNVALSTYPRCPVSNKEIWINDCIGNIERGDFPYMGYTMRHDYMDGNEYRYTEWVAWNGSALRPIWDDVHSIELYNHTGIDLADFDAFENVNIVKQADPILIQNLHKKLVESFNVE